MLAPHLGAKQQCQVSFAENFTCECVAEGMNSLGSFKCQALMHKGDVRGKCLDLPQGAGFPAR